MEALEDQNNEGIPVRLGNHVTQRDYRLQREMLSVIKECIYDKKRHCSATPMSLIPLDYSLYSILCIVFIGALSISQISKLHLSLDWPELHVRGPFFNSNLSSMQNKLAYCL